MLKEIASRYMPAEPVDLAAYGRDTIAKGSKSFALASLLFDDRTKADAQMLYAWCRHCDDVVDGQSLGGDAPDAALSAQEQFARIAELRRETDRALAGETTGHPAFDAFGEVARRRRLPRQYAFDLLDGFEMDAARHDFATLDDTLRYCYGVAGAVGLMMAIVMGVDADDGDTLDRACDLGIAFQLTNISRDVIDDAGAGRVYLPTDLLSRRGLNGLHDVLDPGKRADLALVVNDILVEADRYYESASEGIRRLPVRAASAVAAARNVYRDIGALIAMRGAAAWDQRAHVSGARKTWLAFLGVVDGAPRSVFSGSNQMRPRADLWRRPMGDASASQ